MQKFIHPLMMIFFFSCKGNISIHDETPLEKVDNTIYPCETSKAIKQFGADSMVDIGDASSFDGANTIKVDKFGNFFIVGATTGNFAETNGGNGLRDIYVIKMNKYCEVEFAKQLGAVTALPGTGDTSQNETLGLNQTAFVDDAGNIYIAGATSGNLAETNGGETDAFVVKLNSNGDVVFLKQFGAITAVPSGSTASGDGFGSIEVDQYGNIILFGTTSSNFARVKAVEGSNSDFLLVKLDKNGNLLFAKQWGSDANIYANEWIRDGLSLDSSGNPIICGQSGGSALAEANGGLDDIYIAKLSKVDGSFIFEKQFGAITTLPGGSNSSSDFCSTLYVDKNNSNVIYITGESLSNFGELSAGSYDGFAMKLDANANLIWGKHFGSVTLATISGANGASTDEIRSLVLDKSGHLILLGSTLGSLFGTAAGGKDAFFMKVNSNDGSILASHQLNSDFIAGNFSGDQRTFGLAVDKDNNIYTSGTAPGGMFEATAGDFDSFFIKFKSDFSI